jgi:hypothetical protein
MVARLSINEAAVLNQACYGTSRRMYTVRCAVAQHGICLLHWYAGYNNIFNVSRRLTDFDIAIHTFEWFLIGIQALECCDTGYPGQGTHCPWCQVPNDNGQA